MKKYLKEKRTNANLSQAEVAENLGVSKNTVAAWETGRSTPEVRYLKKLSQLYSLPKTEQERP